VWTVSQGSGQGVQVNMTAKQRGRLGTHHGYSATGVMQVAQHICLLHTSLTGKRNARHVECQSLTQ
jgi:hypothetical protein